MAKASISSPRCTVCAHAERLTIDHLLATGAEHRATARRFDLQRDAISRHYENHVSETWKAAIKVGPYGSRAELEKLCLSEGVTVVQGLRALYASHHALLIAHLETGAWQPYLAVSREIRATLNDIGRITGELLPSVANFNVTNTFNSVTFLSGIGEDLAAEFANMPEALERIHRILQRQATAALPSPDVIEGVARAA